MWFSRLKEYGLQLRNFNYLSDPLLFSWFCCSVSQGCHAVNHMVIRNLELPQDAPDPGLIADTLKLVDPHGTDSQRMGRQENVFQGAGIVLLSKAALLQIRRNDQRCRAIHIVSVPSELGGNGLCQLLDFSGLDTTVNCQVW